MDQVAHASQEIVKNIQKAYQAGRLKVPSLPEIIHRVRKVINNDQASASQIARVVQADPALAARLVQVANSALYRGTGKTSDCRGAICRLGLETTRNLVTGFALRQVFKSKSLLINDVFRQVWQHSSRVAAISYVIARVVPGLLPDKSLLAGLVHDIGVLPILVYAQDYLPLRKNRAALEQLIEILSPKLGHMVLSSWEFESDLVQLPLNIENPNYAPAQPADYIDVVIVAHVHSLFGKTDEKPSTQLGGIASFKKLGISKLGPDASIELLESAHDEVRNLMSMLAGRG